MWCEENKTVKGLFFKQTCMAAPEQYDVFLGDKYVAYVRCRWGKLKVNPVDAEIIVPNVTEISDENFDILEDALNMYAHTIFSEYIYFKTWEDEPFKSDIPEEEFEKIADAIHEYLGQ